MLQIAVYTVIENVVRQLDRNAWVVGRLTRTRVGELPRIME
jgi:hypothetical protein